MANGSTKLRTARVIDAFLVFGIFGAISVLLDLDHIPILFQKGLPITAENLINHSARDLHLPILILVGLLCCVSFASVYRFRDSAL